MSCHITLYYIISHLYFCLHHSVVARQMGVAGDGNKGLDKFDMTQMAKSKTMSAKNAWGTSTGYAGTCLFLIIETL